jgi:hypothetical protein
MANNRDPVTDPVEARIYQIRIEGHFGPQWMDWFEELTITSAEGGDTLLTGPVPDQAALHGLLKKVRDLGVPLIAVNRIEARQPDGLEIHQPHQKRSKGDSNEHRQKEV